jgi:hypothetical protein
LIFLIQPEGWFYVLILFLNSWSNLWYHEHLDL